MPSVRAICLTDSPSSSWSTTIARRRASSWLNARSTAIRATYAASGSPGAASGGWAAACRTRTTARRRRSRDRLTRVRINHACSPSWPTGKDPGRRATRTNVSCTRSRASSWLTESRRASRKSRSWWASNTRVRSLSTSSAHVCGKTASTSVGAPILNKTRDHGKALVRHSIEPTVCIQPTAPAMPTARRMRFVSSTGASWTPPPLKSEQGRPIPA